MYLLGGIHLSPCPNFFTCERWVCIFLGCHVFIYMGALMFVLDKKGRSLPILVLFMFIINNIFYGLKWLMKCDMFVTWTLRGGKKWPRDDIGKTWNEWSKPAFKIVWDGGMAYVYVLMRLIYSYTLKTKSKRRHLVELPLHSYINTYNTV